jgi:phosphoglycolate phosphatase
MQPLKIDLLIFDLDGTLAETRQDLANAVNYALHKLDKVTLDVPTIASYVGNGVGKLLERSLGKEYTPEEYEEAWRFFHEHYSVHLVDNTCLYPGIKEILEHFSAKKMAVLSNKSHPYTVTMVERLGISPYFQLVMGSQDGLERKPSPQVILHILKQLDAAPQETVIIGDTSNDIEAGQAAGIHTCAVTFGYRSAEEIAPFRPEFTVHRVADLVELFI